MSVKWDLALGAAVYLPLQDAINCAISIHRPDLVGQEEATEDCQKWYYYDYRYGGRPYVDRLGNTQVEEYSLGDLPGARVLDLSEA